MTVSRSHSAFVSLAIHASVIALLFLASGKIAPEIATRVVDVLHLTDPPPLTTPPGIAAKGGGGAHAVAPASEGRLPKIAPRQFVPPMLAVVNPNPKLTMEPTIEGPPELALSPNANIGDPLSRIAGLSGGLGGPLGIGNGHGTGVGDKSGAESGNGDQPYGTVYRAGNGVTMPVLIHRVEPEFSDEARKNKYSGTVVIRADIDPQGRPRNMRVSKSLGMGLDEKALEAVTQWLFKPGTRGGKPVAVSAMIEVTFHLL